jgi:hypothetical protein
MDWFSATPLGKHIGPDDAWEFDKWAIPGEWLAVHYFEAMNCLFRIENALRLLVYIVLKKEYQANWININISSDDAQSFSLASLAAKRADSDRRFGYLLMETKCPLMFLTAGELVRIILSESNWKLFKPFFAAAQDLLKTKLQEIVCIRNAFAHFRPVTPDQVEILKQNGSQILNKFQKEFDELLFGNAGVRFPKWELALTAQNDDEPALLHCDAAISKSGRWVFLNIKSPTHLIKLNTVNETRQINIRGLDLQKFLKTFNNVRQRCLIATERGEASFWGGDSGSPPKISKTIRLVFPNAAARQPDTQCDLLPSEITKSPSESAAHFDVLSTYTTYARRVSLGKSRPWIIDTFTLLDHNLSDLPENWGPHPDHEFEQQTLTGLPKYPWMHYCVSRPLREWPKPVDTL